LSAVTAARARLAAERLYHEGEFVVVVAGDGVRLYPSLKAIAPVRIVDLQGRPLTESDLVPQAGPLVLDPTQLVSHRDSFVVLLQGQPIGSRVTLLKRTDDSLVYHERFILGEAGEQRLALVFDPKTLAVTQVDQTGTMRGQKHEVHLTYSAGRVKGSASLPQPNGEPKTLTIDTTVAAYTYDDNAINVIVPALPLADGKSFPIRVFSSGDGRSKVFTATVSKADSMSVPAGRFDAYKVEVTGGDAPFVFYVGGDTPRRVIQLEIVGTPLSFQLVK
jgi:hypothetical protein